MKTQKKKQPVDFTVNAHPHTQRRGKEKGEKKKENGFKSVQKKKKEKKAREDESSARMIENSKKEREILKKR